jgi:hypothetical protein
LSRIETAAFYNTGLVEIILPASVEVIWSLNFSTIVDRSFPQSDHATLLIVRLSHVDQTQWKFSPRIWQFLSRFVCERSDRPSQSGSNPFEMSIWIVSYESLQQQRSIGWVRWIFFGQRSECNLTDVIGNRRCRCTVHERRTIWIGQRGAWKSELWFLNHPPHT